MLDHALDVSYLRFAKMCTRRAVWLGVDMYYFITFPPMYRYVFVINSSLYVVYSLRTRAAAIIKDDGEDIWRRRGPGGGQGQLRLHKGMNKTFKKVSFPIIFVEKLLI